MPVSLSTARKNEPLLYSEHIHIFTGRNALLTTSRRIACSMFCFSFVSPVTLVGLNFPTTQVDVDVHLPPISSVSEAALRLWYRPIGAEQQISIFDDAYFKCRHARARRVLIADAFHFILISTLGEEVDQSHASFICEAVAADRIPIFSLHALLLLPLLSLRSSRVVMLVQHLWTWKAAATTTCRGCS